MRIYISGVGTDSVWWVPKYILFSFYDLTIFNIDLRRKAWEEIRKLKKKRRK